MSKILLTGGAALLGAVVYGLYYFVLDSLPPMEPFLRVWDGLPPG